MKITTTTKQVARTIRTFGWAAGVIAAAIATHQSRRIAELEEENAILLASRKRSLKDASDVRRLLDHLPTWLTSAIIDPSQEGYVPALGASREIVTRFGVFRLEIDQFTFATRQDITVYFPSEFTRDADLARKFGELTGYRLVLLDNFNRNGLVGGIIRACSDDSPDTLVPLPINTAALKLLEALNALAATTA